MEDIIQILNKEILPFNINDKVTYQPVIDRVADASFVLLGEATHGTDEFYRVRIELSKRLIAEKNFQAIAIEGDWTSSYGINQYIRGFGDINQPEIAFDNFNRFPVWMWRNQPMLAFVKWLRNYNDISNNKIGFYGLDLYCLHASIQAVIDYLKQHHPEAARKAIERYDCFDDLARHPQKYGYLVNSDLKKSCIQQVAEQLIEMQKITMEKFYGNNTEALFYATENARVVKDAENYYRSLFDSYEVSWNVRDTHMLETTKQLMLHLKKDYSNPKIIIWAHNSHIGDARATEMSQRCEINLGQLIRENYPRQSFHLGFSTYTGTVTAANEWNGREYCKQIVPGLPESYEELFHELNEKNFLLDLQHSNAMPFPRLQRAIGVIYRPETERYSHYFFSQLNKQFDALIHLDTTHAIEPL